MVRKPERKGLGRGLSALLAETEGAAEPQGAGTGPDFSMVPIEHVRPNPDQPRRRFAEEELAELAQSIARSGILQPLVVRPDPDDRRRFQIVAGERRWRAAQKAQLHEVPVILRELTDEQVLEISIVENIQRVDLNPVEEAESLRKLIDRFGHTQDALAQALGKSRSHIANTLRLLNLSGAALAALRDGRISAGHARALLSAPAPEALLRAILDKGLTVRQAEAEARRGPARVQKPRRAAPQKDADTRAIEGDLSATLGMAVRIDHTPDNDGGTLSIRYRTLDDLDRLLEILGGV